MPTDLENALWYRKELNRIEAKLKKAEAVVALAKMIDEKFDDADELERCELLLNLHDRIASYEGKEGL